jgi:hypothetical protein
MLTAAIATAAAAAAAAAHLSVSLLQYKIPITQRNMLTCTCKTTASCDHLSVL